ncbi:RNA-directed DNA polymerase, eukaryota [Tanacetum coccineum]
MGSIDLSSVRSCWGNSNFDYVHSDSVGNSGGILCIWDPNSFRRSSFTRSDYFVIVRGVWLKSGIDLMIVVVYAPQEAKEKRMLWDYLAHVSNQWVGKLVMMGDFNEALQFISDHRPILLREVRYDYGPIPFRFYRYWLEVDGCGKLVQGFLERSALLTRKMTFETSWFDKPSVIQRVWIPSAHLSTPLSIDLESGYWNALVSKMVVNGIYKEFKRSSALHLQMATDYFSKSPCLPLPWLCDGDMQAVLGIDFEGLFRMEVCSYSDVIDDAFKEPISERRGVDSFVTLPFFVLHGEADTVTDPELAEGPSITLVCVFRVISFWLDKRLVDQLTSTVVYGVFRQGKASSPPSLHRGQNKYLRGWKAPKMHSAM